MMDKFKIIKNSALSLSVIGLVISAKIFYEDMKSNQKVDTFQYYYSLAGVIVFSTILVSCFLVWYVSKNNKN